MSQNVEKGIPFEEIEVREDLATVLLFEQYNDAVLLQGLGRSDDEVNVIRESHFIDQQIFTSERMENLIR